MFGLQLRKVLRNEERRKESEEKLEQVSAVQRSAGGKGKASPILDDESIIGIGPSDASWQKKSASSQRYNSKVYRIYVCPNVCFVF